MLCTLIASQNKPPPDRPILPDPPPFQLPIVSDLENHISGREDHQRDRDDRYDGWNLRDDRQFRDVDNFREGNCDDRLLQTRPLRLDFLRFDGENPAGWTYKVNQFFDYYQKYLYQRICMASFHMEGDALIWFQDVDDSGQFPTWDAFI
jgi:hypothetical protein